MPSTFRSIAPKAKGAVSNRRIRLRPLAPTPRPSFKISPLLSFSLSIKRQLQLAPHLSFILFAPRHFLLPATRTQTLASDFSSHSTQTFSRPFVHPSTSFLSHASLAMSPSLVTTLASAALLAAMLAQTATAASPQKLAKRYVGSDFETEFSALRSRCRCHSQSRKDH